MGGRGAPPELVHAVIGDSDGQALRVVVVGDTVLDVDVHGIAERLCPDGPAPVVEERHRCERPGGAGLAAVMLARDGHDVTLITSTGDCTAGAQVTNLLEAHGVRVVDLGGGVTVVKRRLRVGATTVARWDTRGPASATRSVGAAAFAVGGVLRRADVVLVADYGLGTAARPEVRAALADASVPVVWDPHPNGTDPIPGCWVTPNEREAGIAEGTALTSAVAAARHLCRRWSASGVVVTRGRRGAVMTLASGAPLVLEAPRVPAGGPSAPEPDACGAGDRFSSSLAAALGAGTEPALAARSAVEAASSYVLSGGVGTLAGPAGLTPVDDTGPRPAGWSSWAAERSVEVQGPPGMGEVLRTSSSRSSSTRRSSTQSSRCPAPETDPRSVPDLRGVPGLRVVAAGGCFDLLHAGHVRLLEAARRLGDVLVVCLNSDSSVRRIKGPDRPLVGEDDRRHVLQGLAAVDHVVIFDEPTPERILDELRPDVFVKGGDYFGRDLPEADLLARWGGEVVCVPLLPGRSTTGLLSVVRASASA